MSATKTHIEPHKKLVPELRFKEFEKKWYKKDFGSIVEKTKAKHDPKKSKDEYPCIEMESISKESSILLEVFNSKNQLSIKNKFSKGDVLFGKLRPNLKKYILAPYDGVCSSEIWVLKGKELSNDFLFRLIQTNKFYLSTLVTSGSKMPRADWAYISSSIFPFPSLPEQQKIASFLSAVDEKIQQLTKKKEFLEQYKKGVMQQLFSGKLRFKDENGKDYPDWEEKRLGEIADIKRGAGSQYISYVNSSVDGIRLIRITDFLGGEPVYVQETDDIKRFTLEKDDILIAGTGATAGITFKIPDELIDLAFSYNAPRIRMVNGNSEFTIQYLKSSIILRQQNALFTGNAQPFLDTKAIKNFKMFIPSSEEEQEKIANYLSSIDTKIEAVSNQITQTHKYKRGLLQQMFV